MTKEELKKLKEATRKLSTWESSGKVFGHFRKIETKATNKQGADKIYEFYCLMRLLDDLRVHYKIMLRPGTRTNKIFPESPSPKKGWPYFEIENKTKISNKFQVCYGTNIKLSRAPLTTLAPDISIQKHDSTEDPDESMVELIMDAKFKYDHSDALPIAQLHEFIQRVNSLRTKNASSITLTLNSLINIKANCLLTNGRALIDQHDYCVLYKIKQVEHFDIGKSHNTVG